MGVTAENVAKKWNISREDQDKLAAESHRRAANAIDKGYFKEQIVPVEIKVKGGTVPFETDETVRRDSTVEKLARLKPVFDKSGTVTAGNASSINDAAAAVVLMERGLAEKRGLQAAGPAGGLQLRRRRSEVHGHRPGAGGAGAAQEDRPEPEGHRRVRGQRGVRGPGAGGAARAWNCRRIAPTPTAAASRSATRSARPAAS